MRTNLSWYSSFGFQIRLLVVIYRARVSSTAMLVRLTVLMETLHVTHVTHVTHDLFGVCKQHIIYRVHLFISIQRARKYRLTTPGVHKNYLNLDLHALQLTTSPICKSFRQIVLCFSLFLSSKTKTSLFQRNTITWALNLWIRLKIKKKPETQRRLIDDDNIFRF